jgi:hypothetical protein
VSKSLAAFARRALGHAFSCRKRWSLIYQAKVGGAVPTLADDPKRVSMPAVQRRPKNRRRWTASSCLPWGARSGVVKQAGWRQTTNEEQERTATIIGSGVGGFGAIADAVRITDSRGPRRLVAIHHPFVSGQSGGWACVDPAWLSKAYGRTGDRMCGRGSGHWRRGADDSCR